MLVSVKDEPIVIPCFEVLAHCNSDRTSIRSAPFHGVNEQSMFWIVGEIAFVTAGDGRNARIGPLNSVCRDSKPIVESGGLVGLIRVRGIVNNHAGVVVSVGAWSPVQTIGTDPQPLVGTTDVNSKLLFLGHPKRGCSDLDGFVWLGISNHRTFLLW